MLIGLYSDTPGNWMWADGQAADMDFITAHSYEPSASGTTNVGISNDATRSVGIITRTAHRASLIMGVMVSTDPVPQRHEGEPGGLPLADAQLGGRLGAD